MMKKKKRRSKRGILIVKKKKKKTDLKTMIYLMVVATNPPITERTRNQSKVK